jgi:hypothetical protein
MAREYTDEVFHRQAIQSHLKPEVLGKLRQFKFLPDEDPGGLSVRHRSIAKGNHRGELWRKSVTSGIDRGAG